jgi:DNA polymerase-3 subunit gamma/tau
MASQVFYRKWRPQTLAEVVGQEHVTQTLLNALASQRVSHAYLFCGPRGTGKTSTARSLAKAVNCLSNDGKGEPCNTCPMCQAISEGRALDIIEVDAASNRGIDEIRDLREKVNYAPNEARYKVYIIDEVHMLTKEASNALLKTLEEPPPHIIFVLATTEAHKMLPTILSRCQRFDFHRISPEDVVAKLTRICKTEGISAEAEALRLIARAATGSLRDAENLLQQLTTYYGADIKLEQVQAILGISADWRTKELVKHIIAGDIPTGVNTINNVNSDGLDLRQFNRELVEYLRVLLLLKTGANIAMDIPTEDIAELKELAASASLPRILRAVKVFGQLELGLDNYSTLPLELALVDCATPVTEARAEAKEAPAPAARPRPAAKKPEPPATTPPPEKPATPPEAVKAEEPAPAAEAATEEEPAEKTGPAPKAEAEVPAPAVMESTIEQLQLHWTKIINEAPDGRGKTPAAALLRSAKPLQLEGDTIVIAFKYPYHKEKMDQAENQKTAEKIISGFLGRPCQLRCVFEHENNHLVKAALKMGAKYADTEESES